MATDSGQNSFRRGVMSLVILGLLKKEDMYGYQLVQETERKSGGRITTQEGSLYPVLYKLVDQGLISDRKVLVGKRMTRVYYHLEPAGEQRLKELIREYEEVTNGVLQIIEGCDMDGLECPSSAVSMGSARGTAGQQEEQILSRVESSVRDFVTENPHADYAAITQRFGTPQQIAASYIEEMSTPELTQQLRIKKRIVYIIGATALVLVLIWAGFVLAVTIDSHKSINGYGRYGEVTVIEEIEIK